MQITYHGIDASPALNQLIEERASQLERVSDRIHGLRVVVDRLRHGDYHIHVELSVPGHDLVIGDHAADHHDAYAAVRRAFDIARRRLTTTQSRRR